MQSLALEETKEFIKNYCHLMTIPSEMNFVWANMAFDLLQGAYIKTSSAEVIDSFKPCEIDSVSAGDMSFSRSGDSKAHKVDLDSLLLNYKDQLNQFRRVNWGVPRGQFWGL